MVNGVVVRGDASIVSPYVTLWSQPDDQGGTKRLFFLADVDEPIGGPPNYDGNRWQEQQFPGSNPYDYNPPLEDEVTSYDCTEGCEHGLITFTSGDLGFFPIEAGTLYQGQVDLDEYKQVSPNVGGLGFYQIFRETTDIAVGKVANMGTTVTPVNGDRNPNNTVIHLIQKGMSNGDDRSGGDIPAWVVGFPQGVTDNAPTNFENDQVRWWGIIKLIALDQGEWFDINLTDLAGQYAVAITTKGIITQVKLNTPVLDPASPQAPSQYIIPDAQPPNNPLLGGRLRREWINLCEIKLEINLQSNINNETVIGFCAQRKGINQLQSKIAIVTLPGKLYVGEVNTGVGYLTFKKTEFKIGDDYCATPEWENVTINDRGDKLTTVGRYQNDLVIKKFNIALAIIILIVLTFFSHDIRERQLVIINELKYSASIHNNKFY